MSAGSLFTYRSIGLSQRATGCVAAWIHRDHPKQTNSVALTERNLQVVYWCTILRLSQRYCWSSYLLGCYAVSTGKSLPTFRRKVPSKRRQVPNDKKWRPRRRASSGGLPFKMGSNRHNTAISRFLPRRKHSASPLHISAILWKQSLLIPITNQTPRINSWKKLLCTDNPYEEVGSIMGLNSTKFPLFPVSVTFWT
jgi:hypothetical protein